MGSPRTRAPGQLKRLAPIVLGAVVTLAAASCTISESVTGRLVAVDADLAAVRSITLATVSGEHLEFVVRDDADFGHFTPGHFNQHLINADVLTVVYIEENGVKFAISFTEP